MDADPDKNGQKSDHRIVIVRPIFVINYKCSRVTRTVKVRPFPQSGISKLREWFIEQTWKKVFEAETAHEKADIFQKMLLEKMNEIFPEKTRKLQSDDQPWISYKLKKMDRKHKTIYSKERRSEKWHTLDKLFKKEVKSAKASFYKQAVADLKVKKPGQWYSALKKISSFDQLKAEQLIVSDISHRSTAG